MSKLEELEQRLRDEPDNVGLKVTVAGALSAAGRQDEAVELYRSVALEYRDQGRTPQAIAVCRSVLEIAPGDAECHALHAQLVADHQGRSSRDDTPLPRPIPYHVHDPTTSMVKKVLDADLLPAVEGADTRPGVEASTTQPEPSGMASAARRISASLVGSTGARDEREDMAVELDTRRVARIATRDLEKLSRPPPTVPIERVDLELDDAAAARPPEVGIPEGTTDDEQTQPRALVAGPHTRTPSQETLVSPFFAPLPAERRVAVLERFQRRTAIAGTIVIRQGETNHPFVIVARGRLDVCVERSGGAMVQVGSIALGEYVGEAALLARTPAAAHVIAAGEVELWILPPRDFYEIAGAFPALWAELKDVAERRTREHEQRIGRS